MDAPTVRSVNVGTPRSVHYRGRTVTTSIWKHPVAGRVVVGPFGLQGDEQSDRVGHGGAQKSVYAYPAAHYPAWRERLGVDDLPWGSLGENLTVDGLEERSVHPGDHLRIGTAELAITQPRWPCFKLNVRFDREDLIRLFETAGDSGFYCTVVRAGSIGAGDPIDLRHGPDCSRSIHTIFRERTGPAAAEPG